MSTETTPKAVIDSLIRSHQEIRDKDEEITDALDKALSPYINAWAKAHGYGPGWSLDVNAEFHDYAVSRAGAVSLKAYYRGCSSTRSVPLDDLLGYLDSDKQEQVRQEKVQEEIAAAEKRARDAEAEATRAAATASRLRATLGGVG